MLRVKSWPRPIGLQALIDTSMASIINFTILGVYLAEWSLTQNFKQFKFGRVGLLALPTDAGELNLAFHPFFIFVILQIMQIATTSQIFYCIINANTWHVLLHLGYVAKYDK